MNRKNLTAAVLAGLAGAAGLAATAQAVNMNPDGVGQVLIYPYYTTNDGNQTVLSVVNTTENAKAVKVRFLEGFNSREVLDFNLYMSREDVWTAAVFDGGDVFPDVPEVDGVPHMITFDTSCTVPYFRVDSDGLPASDGTPVPVAFLDIAYTDNGGDFNFTDGGPTTIERAKEGHFEVIEMATVTPDSDTEEDITHVVHPAEKDKDGNVTREAFWGPGDCAQLVANWTRKSNYDPLGKWTCELDDDLIPDEQCDDSAIDMDRNSGGLFGGAAIVNAQNGTMYSYNALAIQGFDKNRDELTLHYEPGTIHPSLDDGDQKTAVVFFGVPQNDVAYLNYNRGVDAVSALFMKENIMNEFTVEAVASASTEWVVTFPTKNFYVDELILFEEGDFVRVWEPDAGDEIACRGWQPGDYNPLNDLESTCSGFNVEDPGGNGKTPSQCINDGDFPTGWDYTNCSFVAEDEFGARAPFTEVFDGTACEEATISIWDREEIPLDPARRTGPNRPPVVSPSLPRDCDPSVEDCDVPVFQLCYEVNVLRFENADGGGSIFGTPDIDGDSLLLTVTMTDSDEDYTTWENGWAQIDLYEADSDHQDRQGLVGLPATGFAAYEFENDFVDGGSVKAYYGGLFMHRGNVRRVDSRGD
ncbi:MAG: hypothetical protein KJO33_01175 [Gammaproteobacteria bacterium]|nr:hypothetical protein [Gammaproteobacteria bacterium]